MYLFSTARNSWQNHWREMRDAFNRIEYDEMNESQVSFDQVQVNQHTSSLKMISGPFLKA